MDEKQFYLVKEKQGVRLCTEEDVDLLIECGKVCHKSHIPKIMFLLCIMRPRLLPDGTRFSGKIACIDLTEKIAAVRKSANRAAGTLVTTPLSVGADVFFETMTRPDGVFAHVKQNAFLRGENLILRLDNAKAHMGHHNFDRLEKAFNKNGWKLSIARDRPGQSPDMHPLDLAFNWSLQKRSDRMMRDAHDLDELIDAVKRAWEEYDFETQDRAYGCLRAVYEEILKAGGTNDYRVPHSGVRRLQNDRRDVVDVAVSARLIDRVIAHVQHYEQHHERLPLESDDEDEEAD